MDTDNGFIRFTRLMVEFSFEYLDPVLTLKKEGGELKRPTDNAFSSVVHGFTDIAATLYALKLTETLIGLAPPRSRKVSKDEYIKFLVGAYLQEVYVLEQRLSAYAKKTARLYKNNELLPLVSQLIDKPFNEIKSTRGSHVHDRRYSDENLDTVSSFVLFSHIKKEYADELRSEYKHAQIVWKARIAANNQATSAVVDRYFDLLFEAIFPNGKIVFPSVAKKTAR